MKKWWWCEMRYTAKLFSIHNTKEIRLYLTTLAAIAFGLLIVGTHCVLPTVAEYVTTKLEYNFSSC